MLFHKELGLPEEILKPYLGHSFHFRFSNHALKACLSDRYGTIVPPSCVTVLRDQIIEVETDDFDGTTLFKIVCRLPYNSTCDVVIAFIPNFGGASTVKTVWLNRNSDVHATLDESKYCKLI